MGFFYTPQPAPNRYDAFAADLPIKGIILVTTGVETALSRIATRGRGGEDGARIQLLKLKELTRATHPYAANPSPPPPPLPPPLFPLSTLLICTRSMKNG